MFRFDLVDEGWIPCVLADGGRLECLGLRETLRRAPEIREVADGSPLVTAGLHRLLLAILHRNFGPGSEDEWYTVWSEGAFPCDRLDEYFERWRERFDLFHAERPFYQCGSVKPEYAVPVAKLSPELASGNNATLFDHTMEERSPEFNPGRAARALVALQSFAVGGLVSLEKGQDPKLFKSARGAPLAKGAVVLIKGANLLQTLLLNLHRYAPVDEEPFAVTGEDLPAWERGREPGAGDRYPSGYLDLLTWQSRRVLLLPERSESGMVVVRKAVIMKGEQFPEGWSTRGRETMLCFRANPRAKNREEPWLAIGFEPGRAVWRDSLSLLESLGDQRQRPRTVDWVHDLVGAGHVALSATFSLDLLGQNSNQAKILLWRHERMPLAVGYLEERGLVERLGAGLELAERVAGVLLSETESLVRGVLEPALGAPGKGRQPDRKRVRALPEVLAPERSYWGTLDIEFGGFLVRLVADCGKSEDGAIEYGRTEMPRWAEVVRGAARRAFETVCTGLGTAPRVLKAVSLAESSFRRRLGALVRPWMVSREEVANDSSTE
jgi:CRISPR system Cascade subunit CasA